MKTGAGVVTGMALVISCVAFTSQVEAAPVSLTGGTSYNGNTISGALYGDLNGDILTLNAGSPTSTLVIDVKDPDPVPVDPISDHNRYCFPYLCTVTINPNGSTSVNLPAWTFDMGGVVDFGAGTATLTANPQSPAIFATDTTVLTPTFGVVADDYGFQQLLADGAAATVRSILNLGTPTLTVNGTGTWESIDLGTIGASLIDDGNATMVDLMLDGVELRGVYSFNANLSFPGNVADTLGNTFESFFESLINDQLRALYADSIDGFRALGDQDGLVCSTSRRTDTSLNVICRGDSTVMLAGDSLIAPRVSAPAMAGLFGLAMLGVGLAGAGRARRRHHGIS